LWRGPHRAAAEVFAADVGITGANFLIAETGTSIIVTNEGNGDLTQTCPRSTSSSPRSRRSCRRWRTCRADPARAGALGDGQEISSTPRSRPGRGAPAIPTGRKNITSSCSTTAARDARHRVPGHAALHPLRRLHEPLPGLHAVGGHAYGWVYPGPMGAVLTPSLIGVDKAGHLPNASTFCGRCESVCPMRIPLPKMMRHWREKEFERHLMTSIACASSPR
jgi:L-lactate dehydrogenase complex protein LldF